MINPPDHQKKLPPISAANSWESIEPEMVLPEIEGYQIHDKLGEGGMGTVWRSRQLSTHREVALKVTTAKAFRSERARTRFEREVELAGRLEHPHIARVYDSGLQRGAYYYAMELVTGQHLDTFVKEQKLTTDQILRLLHAVCLAVHYAHQRGIIHRDLKPSNILVTADAQPHILDFGLAKDIFNASEGKAVSLDGDILGTPAYMSPEQAAGRLDDVDTRSDVYSLGVILYNLLTHDWPYDVSGTYYDVLKNIQEQEPRRPSKLAPFFDMDVEAILLKALAKEQDQRYQSMAQFAEDIQRRIEGLPVSARSATTMYLVHKWMARNKTATAVAGLVAVILLSTGFIGAYSYSQTQAAMQELQRQQQTHQAELKGNQALMHRTAFGLSLGLWQEGKHTAAQLLIRYLPGNSSEHRAILFLLDKRPFALKGTEIEKYLSGDQAAFWQFIVGECHLKEGNLAEAEKAYRICLEISAGGNADEWFREDAQARINELKQVSEPNPALSHQGHRP